LLDCRLRRQSVLPVPDKTDRREQGARSRSYPHEAMSDDLVEQIFSGRLRKKSTYFEITRAPAVSKIIATAHLGPSTFLLVARYYYLESELSVSVEKKRQVESIGGQGPWPIEAWLLTTGKDAVHVHPRTTAAACRPTSTGSAQRIPRLCDTWSGPENPSSPNSGRQAVRL
jgi:hypothetical protein